jgi:UDP-glucuronate 4-epimerase
VSPSAGASTVLVTGGAGFIGSHLCERLVRRGCTVVALDSFDPFYDPAVKRRNVAALREAKRFRLVEADIRDLAQVERALDDAGIGGVDAVVHLAARAGVRPSIEAPVLYSEVNVAGTAAMLELACRRGISRFVFGSSSSVYGNNAKVPFSEADPVDHPISPYAATKRAGELLCHTYRHVHGLSVVALRFFTVYGPRQRPDLAIHKFGRLMLEGRPIPLFGDGTTARDYTFVDDIVRGIEGAIAYTGAHPGAFEIVNLGGSRPATLRRLVELLSEAFGVEPRVQWLPAQPGDVERTYADVGRARELLGYVPEVPLEEGIPRFAAWLREESSILCGV